jgi:hypothetical protein
MAVNQQDEASALVGVAHPDVGQPRAVPKRDLSTFVDPIAPRLHASTALAPRAMRSQS